MPMYDPDHVEYNVTSGHIQIAMESGEMLPAFWAHPSITTRFPGVALIHDWWGVNGITRQLAHLLAQVGHYVIVPDLFDGQTASTPTEALALLEKLGSKGYNRIDTALSVLETHHQCNADVAAIGLGMGGSLAFEAAIRRADLEAAVAYAGFPQRYLGHFHKSNTPILAFYGTRDQYVPAAVIDRLRDELAACPVEHAVVMLDGAGHDIYADSLPERQRELSRVAWHRMLDFLETYLEGPTQPPDRKRY